jgi:hypothetical protein
MSHDRIRPAVSTARQRGEIEPKSSYEPVQQSDVIAGKTQHHATPVAAAVEPMAFQYPAHLFLGVLIEASADPQLEVQVLPDFLHAEFRVADAPAPRAPLK